MNAPRRRVPEAMALDLWLARAINRGLIHPSLDDVMVALTLFGLLPFLIAPIWWRARGEVKASRVALGVLLAALALTLVAQGIIQRPRPQGLRMLLDPLRFPSFPSGHAAISASLAAFAGLLRPRFAVPAAVYALLIGWSRIHVGHHYPADVLAGLVLGAAVGATGYGLFLSDPSVRPRWSWLLWAQLGLCLLAGFGATLGLTKLQVLSLFGADKVLHFGLFALLAALIAAWCEAPAAIVTLSSLGGLTVIDEVLQRWVPSRSFDPIDLVCTLAGILAGGMAGLWLRRQWRGAGGEIAPAPRAPLLTSPGSASGPHHHPG
jgi:membrane-associated phospholipid phosphatase